MDKIRCVVCGSSRLDQEGYKCARCGGPIGSRSEGLKVSGETKLKLIAHASELSRFGIRIEIARSARLQKDVLANMAIDAMNIVLAIETLRPGTVRQVVVFLRDWAIPEPEILALRLGEPEEILKYCRMDQKQEDTAIKWKGPKLSPSSGAIVSKSNPPKRSRPRKKARPAVRRKPKRS